MPKINTDVAAKIEQAEDGFKPVPEGVYTLQLMEDVDVKEGAAGPYWRWSFEVPSDEGLEGAGRRFWTNTSLSEAAYFKLKETFAAFGVPVDTDTEDLVGRRVKALIIIKTIQGGSRKGELGNEISKLMPLDAPDTTDSANGEKVLAAVSGSNKADAEPMF